MINVLEIRPNPNSKSNGIDKYCQSIRRMFEGDEVINILPVENHPMKKYRVLKEIYSEGVLKKLFNLDDIDVIHINGFASFSVVQCFWYAMKAKKKIVYTAHWHPFKYLNHPIRAKVFFYLFLKPLVKRFANIIVSINNEDTAFFRKFHSNVVQIPHWIDSSQVRSCLETKDPSMILFVGRVNDPNKGAEHLYSLPEGKYNIQCVGPCEGVLRCDMESHVNISEEELSLLYQKASLLVVPSRYEAFSYVALEALAHGTPVLLSDRVRIGDYLKEVEGVGIFKYHDNSDFEYNVKKMIGREVDKVKVMSLFSKDAIKSLYYNVFLNCDLKDNTFLNIRK